MYVWMLLDYESLNKLINSIDNKYYVYILLHPISLLPIYVGKGIRNRVLDHGTNRVHYCYERSKYTKLCNLISDIINKYGNLKYKIKVCKNEKEAYDLEINTIKSLGRIDNSTGILYNRTDGGDGGLTIDKEIFKKKLIDYCNNFDITIIGEYVRHDIAIEMFCNKHGKFKIKPFNAYHRKNPCDKCSREAGSTTIKSTNEIFINKAKKVHDNKYNYDNVVYINNRIKVDVICEHHGIFKISPHKHLLGRGCRKCHITNNGEKADLSLKEIRDNIYNKCIKNPTYNTYNMLAKKYGYKQRVIEKIYKQEKDKRGSKIT